MAMTTELTGLVRLAKAQIKRASEVLARSFQDNPLTTYWIPDEAERKSMLHYIHESALRYAVLDGEVYATSPALEGVALWLLPEKAGEPPPSMSTTRKVKSDVWKRVIHSSDFASLIHKRHTRFPHWYLWIIGVDPKFQGKGYASALLRPMLARIDQEHLPCYLETETEKNVPLYQHYGFEIIEETVIPDSEVSHWSMLRKIV